MKSIILIKILCCCILLSIVTNISAQVPSYVPTSGLVGWWPFSGNANDFSGNGNNGTNYGAALTSDRFGNANSAYNFDCTTWSWGSGGNEIYIPYNSSFNSPNLSVSVWAYRTAAGCNNQGLVIATRYQYGYSNPNGETWRIEAGPSPSDHIYTTVYQASSISSQSSISNTGDVLPLNTWINITMTFDGVSVNQYINGVLYQSLPANGLTLNAVGNSGISIGMSDQANGHWGPFAGMIDDIGIWSRALSPQEVTQLYLSGASCPTVGAIQGASTVQKSNTITLSDTTAGGTWVSSNSNIATISNTGVVTGIAAGTDTISYTVNTACGPVRVTKVITVTNPCLPSYVPTNGLVGWWPFCGNANDESGNGNNGTINGATLTTDRFGTANSAYYFSGSGCATRIDANVNTSSIQNSLTFSYWFLQSGNGCVSPRTFEFGTGSQVSGFLQSKNLNTYNSLAFITGSNQNIGLVCPSTPINQWANITFSIDNTIAKLYYNGILADSQIVNGGSINLNSIMCVGRMNHPAYDAHEGDIDDIGIWNRALSPQEIQALYSGSALTANITQNDTTICSGQSITLTVNTDTAYQYCSSAALPSNLQSGLVGYWPFCGNANDVSGNGNNGTNNGATLINDRFGNANSAYELSTLTDNLTVNNVQPAFNNNALSVSLWMKFPTQYNQSSLALVKNGTPYTNGFNVAIDQNNAAYGVNNYLVVFLVGNGVPVSFIANQAELGVWSNIVSTYDGSNIKIYLNGILKATQSFNQSMNIPNNNLVIGSWDNPTTPAVRTRQIDDIGIWNRALTAQEVQQLYNLNTATYQWNTGDTTNSITITPAQSRTYTVSVSQNGQSTTDSVRVNVDKPNVLIAATDTVICSGDSILLSATGASSYLWNNGVTTSNTYGNHTALYTVTGTDTLGCKSTARINMITADTLTWTGGVDTNWHKPCNWNPAKVPSCCNTVIIPNTINKPVVSGVAGCKAITIYSTSGARMQVNTGANLQIEQCPTPVRKDSCP